MTDISALITFTTQIVPEIVAAVGMVSVSKVKSFGNGVYKVTYDVSALMASTTQIAPKIVVTMDMVFERKV